MDDQQPDRPAKRLKISPDKDPNSSENSPTPNLASLHRSITPPRPSRSSRQNIISPHQPEEQNVNEEDKPRNRPKIIPSPIQLTHIRDFGPSSGNNVDTVRLADILGDPMIRECWQFNYLFDVDFLMQQFDEDVRNLVRVKVVHGSWKRGSQNRVRIDEACSRYPNVEPIVAYMPEPFGTHHSKMMILLRHDGFAQVVIHTANMISGDWANLCQAVWRSPLLPLWTDVHEESESTAWGSGARFKRVLLAYLSEYGVRKTGPLVEQLAKYDFSAVRAALIASVPSKQKISNEDAEKTLWGWPALKDALRRIPLRESIKTPHIVAQISSIASLGQTDKWLKEVFFSALAPLSLTSTPTKRCAPSPQYSIIFPTAEEIRRSLNGYCSGGSIHLKLQSVAQQKQLQYLRRYLCHWAGDVAGDKFPSDARDAGRRRVAPHVKTYVRYRDAQSMDMIDWALVTSANLSTQAWGAAANASGEVRICSWEIGVLVWPELFVTEAQPSVAMMPCFKQDHPVPSQNISHDETELETSALVGFRMPYDLPLTSYSTQDIPWCATMPHPEPDWLGQTWEG